MSYISENPLAIFNLPEPTDDELARMVEFSPYNYGYFKRCLAAALIEKSQMNPEKQSVYEFAIQEAKIQVYQDLVILCEERMRLLAESRQDE